jgi:hypothetical protein
LCSLLELNAKDHASVAKLSRCQRGDDIPLTGAANSQGARFKRPRYRSFDAPTSSLRLAAGLLRAFDVSGDPLKADEGESNGTATGIRERLDRPFHWDGRVRLVSILERGVEGAAGLYSIRD